MSDHDHDEHEQEQEDAVHSLNDVIRNALAMGINSMNKLLFLLEVSNGDQPYPAQLEASMGLTKTALTQQKFMLMKDGLVTDFRDEITRGTRWSLTEWGVRVMKFVEEGGEKPTPEPEAAD